MRQYDHDPKKITVFGMSGSGKSLFAYSFIRAAKYDCFFIFDHDGQFSYRNKVEPAYTAVQLENQWRRRFVVFEPSELFPGKKADAFDFFCEWAFEKSGEIKGKKLFFGDELQLYTESKWISDQVSTLTETGRHRGIDCLLVTQAPNRIHNSILGPATEWVTFQLTVKRQLEPLVDVGFDADQVRALKKFHYLGRTNRGEEYNGRVWP